MNKTEAQEKLEAIKTEMRQLSIRGQKGENINEKLWQLSGEITLVQIGLQK